MIYLKMHAMVDGSDRSVGTIACDSINSGAKVPTPDGPAKARAQHLVFSPPLQSRAETWQACQKPRKKNTGQPVGGETIVQVPVGKAFTRVKTNS